MIFSTNGKHVDIYIGPCRVLDLGPSATSNQFVKRHDTGILLLLIYLTYLMDKLNWVSHAVSDIWVECNIITVCHRCLHVHHFSEPTYPWFSECSDSFFQVHVQILLVDLWEYSTPTIYYKIKRNFLDCVLFCLVWYYCTDLDKSSWTFFCSRPNECVTWIGIIS